VQSRANKLTGPILCLVGPSRRRQDLARQVDREGEREREFRARCVARRACADEARNPRSTARNPISARCPARSSSRCGKAKTSNPPCSCWTRSTRWAADFPPAIRHRLWLEVSRTPSRIRASMITISRSIMISPNVMFITTANTLKYSGTADGPHGDHPGSPAIPKKREGRGSRGASHLIPNAIAKPWPRISKGMVDRRRRPGS